MKTFFAFLGGAVVGAAVALLLAPEKGEVTRGKIREAVNSRVDKAEKAAQSMRRRANKATHDKIEEVAQAAKHL